ncbi:MAG TPA: glycosyltransferase, partial [Ardenticatenaceae bacterium]|nr:glycosyltransferase [Ardenticatenaceae bacterium]
MKIVFVAPFGLRPKGTVSVRALPLGQALVERGHRVTLVVPPWDDRAAAGESFERGGVRVVNLPVPRDARLDVPALTARLLRATLAERPAVVHCFKPKGYSGLLALAWRWLRRARVARAPLVMDTDDWEGAGGWNELAPYPGWQKRFFAWQERTGLAGGNAVTVASRAL